MAGFEELAGHHHSNALKSLTAQEFCRSRSCYGKTLTEREVTTQHHGPQLTSTGP
jgi:hypothetical protein